MMKRMLGGAGFFCEHEMSRVMAMKLEIRKLKLGEAVLYIYILFL